MEAAEIDLAKIGNDEIEKEYIARFGDPGDIDLIDFTSVDLIEELEERGTMPEPEFPILDELADLVAEAAHVSHCAVRAYSILRDIDAGLPSLESRQRLIAGRMRDAA